MCIYPLDIITIPWLWPITYLCPIAPVHFVAIITLRIMGRCYHDASCTAISFYCIRLKEQKSKQKKKMNAIRKVFHFLFSTPPPPLLHHWGSHIRVWSILTDLSHLQRVCITKECHILATLNLGCYSSDVFHIWKISVKTMPYHLMWLTYWLAQQYLKQSHSTKYLFDRAC